ncbi:hypothetical protein PtA15_7A490 [Puccinia triticina]|uniref:Uncharacterized protein n=1 Tax=Puccinia triticina TaxID=208348 RepID=A0ABY7CNE7_9BASI|nr:uncharacterized protein PtA15_7A490 [Puccinia triticina]WAQ86761.1 hypothetical protein PtA15_7A490 [Puccinia triticina]WAR56628.1 hypothetical protein PtB15_7B478 [Puccinia triticina]
MLSNPESLLLASPSITSSSTPLMLSTSNSLAVEVDDTMIRDTQEQEGDPEENNGWFWTETTQPDPFAAPFSTPPRQGRIFFSPPRSLDTLTAKRTQSEDLTRTIHCVRPRDETETVLSADSHLRFLSAFSRAVNRGNMCLDLNAFAQLGRICYFQGLQNLSLRSNQLTKLPSEIGNLRSLRVQAGVQPA